MTPDNLLTTTDQAERVRQKRSDAGVFAGLATAALANALSVRLFFPRMSRRIELRHLSP